MIAPVVIYLFAPVRAEILLGAAEGWLARHSGLVLGLPGAAVYAWTASVVPGSRWDVLGLAVGVFTSPLLTATYVGAMMLLWVPPGTSMY